MVHNMLSILGMLLDAEHEESRQAENRRQDKGEENGWGVVVLGAKAQAAVRMSKQKRPTLPNHLWN